MLKTTSSYKHKQYEIQKSLRIKEERRKERIRKEIEKACNPDQLVKFVTQFRIPTIQDSVTEVARRQAECKGEFVVEREDRFRPTRPDRWMSKSNFNTIFHRKSNLEMNIEKAKSQGSMMVDSKEDELTPSTDTRQPWILAVPDQCNKWENFLARVKVAADQSATNGIYNDKLQYEHRDLAKNRKPFIAKFSLPSKDIPISRKEIPLLTATEAKVRAQPKYAEYPFGWYGDDIEGQIEGLVTDKRHEFSYQDSKGGSTRRFDNLSKGNYVPNTGFSRKARDLDLVRRNVNSRASMTSNVSYIRFSDHDLFDDNATDVSNNGSFRTQTVGTKTGKSRGFRTPGTNRTQN